VERRSCSLQKWVTTDEPVGSFGSAQCLRRADASVFHVAPRVARNPFVVSAVVDLARLSAERIATSAVQHASLPRRCRRSRAAPALPADGIGCERLLAMLDGVAANL
jgi:hypothetical protein